jgi:uncharacterized protein (DUF433 family)
MSSAAVDHPYVSRIPGIASGSAVVIGTKFPVRSIVGYVLRQGMAPEELVREFPFLSLAQVHDALSYYYDHQPEIDAELMENTEAHWRTPTNA